MENEYAGISPYNYGNCNPITFNDPSGMEGERTHNGQPVRYGQRTDDSGTFDQVLGYNDQSGAYDQVLEETEYKGISVLGEKKSNFSVLEGLPNIGVTDGQFAYYKSQNAQFHLNVAKPEESKGVGFMDIFGVAKGTVECGADYLAKNFTIKQYVYNYNPKLGTKFYENKPITFSNKFLVAKDAQLKPIYRVEYNTLEKNNNIIGDVGKAIDYFSLVDKGLDAAIAYDLKNQDSVRCNADYKAKSKDFFIDLTKLVIPMVAKKASPYILAYDAGNLVNNYIQARPDFRASMRKIALEAMNNSTNNRDYNNNKMLLEKYSDTKAPHKCILKQDKITKHDFFQPDIFDPGLSFYLLF